MLATLTSSYSSHIPSLLPELLLPLPSILYSVSHILRSSFYSIAQRFYGIPDRFSSATSHAGDSLSDPSAASTYYTANCLCYSADAVA
ncbi:hypothetical protein G7Y79_00023g053490 [Physcia stellaris]|nr:hypothetical protein G7Y79_00023g053490 [Physcia stellaris]